jgi:phage/plasmid-associated DNA primase
VRVGFWRGGLGVYVQDPSRAAGAAAPDLARAKGKRIALSSEIAKNERINIGFVKEVTGKDSIYVRGLWAQGGEVHPHFTLFMQCNELPKIPGNDGATWERVQVIYFGSHFLVTGAPSSLKEQQRTRVFAADEYLWDELPSMAPVFLWYILRVMYPKFKAGVTTPESVLRYTRAYRMENDIYDQFKNDRLVEVEYDTSAPVTKETPRVKLSEVYSEFKGWFAYNYPSYKERIGKVTMRTELSKVIGPLGEKSSWWGWKLKITDEEEEGGGVE